MKKYILGGVMSLLALNQEVYASELPVDYRNIKAEALGGTFSASANELSGIFANPAGLTLTRNPRNRHGVQGAQLPFPGEVGANDQMLAQMGANPDEWTKNLFDSAKQNPGKQSYLELQTMPAMTFRTGSLHTLMIGLPIRAESRVAYLEGADSSTAYVKTQQTASLAITNAFQTDKGLFRGGFTVRPNYRQSYETFSYPGEDTSTGDFTRKLYQNGITSQAVALDAGMMLTLPDEWFPTLAVSVRNIPTGCFYDYENPITHQKEKMCGTVRSGGSSGDPNEARLDPTEVRAGVSLTPRFRLGRRILNLRVAGDIYPIPLQVGGIRYGIDHIDTEDLYHVGVELFFGGALIQRGLSLRGGWQGGQLSWGSNLALGALNLSYTAYGAKDSLPQPDGTHRDFTERRHMLGISFLF